MNLKNTIEDYLQNNHTETVTRKVLGTLSKRFSEKSLIDRKNFEGHFTASAFIVCRSTKRVLMIKHKVLGFYLQPGGHIEPGDNTLLSAVFREIKEETGLSQEDLHYRAAVPGKEEIPFNIDTHTIPENPKKEEPEHFHHDLNYLFSVEKEIFGKIQDGESQQIDWIDWEDFISYQHFSTIAKKIEQMIL
jgi:8-oxo-dGTP pyrophosphatase MutT (NUDIX family)